MRHILPILLLAPTLHAAVDVSDAPASYGNAFHDLGSGIYLGAGVDADPVAGLASANARGDDNNGTDDEDGVIATSDLPQAIIPWQRGMHTQLKVSVQLPASTAEAKLDVWIDWNRDGSFQIFEKVLATYPVIDGMNPIGIPVPATAVLGTTVMRVRLSSAGFFNPTGPAPDGEVEDHPISVVDPSPATNLAAHQGDGQMWVTWDYDPATLPQVYEIYRCPSAAWTDVSQGQLVARLFPQDYTPMHHMKAWRATNGAQQPDGFTIPDSFGGLIKLPVNRGLCAATVKDSGSFSWAVVPKGVTAVTAANRTALVAQNPISGQPKPHIQYAMFYGISPNPAIPPSGPTVLFTSLWTDGGAPGDVPRTDFPFMGNSSMACRPVLQYIMYHGIIGVHAPMTLALHSGDASAQMWLPETQAFINCGMDPGEDGVVTAMEDNLYTLTNGIPESTTTRWLGGVSAFDRFTNTVSFPYAPASLIAGNAIPSAASVIQPYTLRRLNWTLDWMLDNYHFAPEQISIMGHSGGAKGAMLWSHANPERFASAVLFSPAIGDTSINTTLQPLLGTPALNLATTLTNNTGGTVRMNDTVSLTASLSPQRDMPPTRIYFGQMEGNWVTDDNGDFKSDVIEAAKAADTLGTGVSFHWDQRMHGVNQWTLDALATAMPACTWSTLDLWVPTAAEQTRLDDVMERSRFYNNQSYPAFFNCRNYANHGDIGSVNYGGQLYVENQPWTGPADPCRPEFPAHTGDRRGTWGGYFDWTKYPGANGEIQDTPNQWSALLYLPDRQSEESNLGPFEECPVNELQADVAIRRPQQFKPAPGTSLTWVNYNYETGEVQQYGLAGFDSGDVVTVPGVRVRKQPNYARLVVASQMDFGDAPSCYPVHAFRDGARHLQTSTLRLGATISMEAEATTSGTASADSTTDDGVTLPPVFQPGAGTPVNVHASAVGKVDAWIDWNADGDWTDAGEKVLNAATVVTGANTLSILAPLTAVPGQTFARFRLSTAGGLAPTGAAPDGEVEDYQVNVTATPPASIPPVTLSERPEDRASFTTGTSGEPLLQWVGRSTEQATIEVSQDLVNWSTWFVSGATTTPSALLNLPMPDTGSARLFTRIVRTPVGASDAVPCVPGPHYNLTFVHDGRRRTYSLIIPTQHPTNVCPLALILHGGDMNAEIFMAARGSELTTQAQQHSMILCFPDALEREARGAGWYRYDEIPGRPYADDQAFLDALTAHLTSVLNVNTQRLYLGGFSDGGVMTHYMGARSTTNFAAFAVSGSAIGAGVVHGDPIVMSPAPSAPKPMLVINMKDDTTRPFLGAPQATPAIAQATHWATPNGCPPPITATNSTTTGSTPHRVTIDNYLCPLAPVRFVVLETGGHLWPDAADGLGYDANTEVLNWFMSYTTP